MAYNNSAPSDNILIRLLPSAIRDNFQAIKTGDSTFVQDIANISQQGSDPAAIASTFRLYGKDSGGNTELFGRNSAGTVYQLTGNSSAAFPGHTIVNGLILINWGSFTVPASSPFTNTITFSQAFSSTDYTIVPGVLGSAQSSSTPAFSRSEATADVTSGNGQAGNTWTYIAIGPA